MTSYSQLGQDLEVINFYNYKKKGYYVEIGASDGINLSNTYLLEKNYDWTGICVEAIPDKINILKSNRKNSICISKAVYNTSNLDLSFSISNNNNLLSGLSDHILLFKEIINSNKQDIIVKTITLNDILNENNSPLFIEYLSLDTEGSEYEILQSVDLKKFIFGIIHVEHNYLEPNRNNIRKYLEKNNYIFSKENEFDDVYIHITLIYPVII